MHNWGTITVFFAGISCVLSPKGSGRRAKQGGEGIFTLPWRGRVKRASAIARVLCGAGYAVGFCPIRGAFRFPRAQSEGMERQATHQYSVLPRVHHARAPLGAPSRRSHSGAGPRFLRDRLCPAFGWKGRASRAVALQPRAGALSGPPSASSSRGTLVCPGGVRRRPGAGGTFIPRPQAPHPAPSFRRL